MLSLIFIFKNYCQSDHSPGSGPSFLLRVVLASEAMPGRLKKPANSSAANRLRPFHVLSVGKVFFSRFSKEENTWKNKIEFRVSFSKRISSLFSGSFVYEKQLGEKNSFPADFGIYDSPLSFLLVVGWFLIRTSKKSRHKELLTNSSNIVR